MWWVTRGLWVPLQHTAMHRNKLHHTASHYNTLRHTATYFDTLQHTVAHCYTLQHIAIHCNALQPIATHCNTLLFEKFHDKSMAIWCVKRGSLAHGYLLQHAATYPTTHFDTLQHVLQLQH